MKRAWKTGLLAAVLLAGGGGLALADFAATVNPGALGSADPATFNGYVSGWRFSVVQEFTITHLGLLDLDAPGLTSTHTLGLWKLPKTGGFDFICSVEIGAGQGELIEQHRYMPITPIPLTPDTESPFLNPKDNLLYGDRYLLGVWSPADSPDRIRLGGRAAVTISDVIRLGEHEPPELDFAYDYTAYTWRGPLTTPYASDGSLLPPWGNVSDTQHYGVNFQYTVVPVPGAVLLGALGLSSAGWLLRRRTA